MTPSRGTALRTILVATDLADGGLEAIRAARQIAIPDWSHIHVLHVIDRPSRLPAEAPGGSRPAQIPQGTLGPPDINTMEVKGYGPPPTLDELRQHVEADDVVPDQVEVQLHIRSGTPHRLIHALSEELQADLVILGAHRPRRFLDGLLGSTADRVLRSSRCPVLILGHPLTIPPRRILVASDLSPHSDRALSVALAWSRKWAEKTGPAPGGRGIDIGVLAVADYARPGYRALPFSLLLQRQVDRLSTDVPPGIRITSTSLAFPTAGEGIQHMAESLRADLVFMGSHGHGPFLQALYGSVTSEVIRTLRLATVVVPPGGMPDAE